MKKVLLISLLFPAMVQAKMRYVDGGPLADYDKAAINQNFSDADRLINSKVPASAEKFTINISSFNVNGRIKDVMGYVAPVGSVTMYVGATAPDGWLLCDGSSVLRATYPDLFAISTCTYGCADATHFTLPDMRGVFPKGAGTTDRAAGVDSSGNYYGGTLGTYSQDKLQGHYHTYYDAAVGTGVMYSGVSSRDRDGDGYSSTNGFIGAPSQDGTNGEPRYGHTTEPQSLGLTFIIKY
jgi:hypothetical protein